MPYQEKTSTSLGPDQRPQGHETHSASNLHVIELTSDWFLPERHQFTFGCSDRYADLLIDQAGDNPWPPVKTNNIVHWDLTDPTADYEARECTSNMLHTLIRKEYGEDMPFHFFVGTLDDVATIGSNARLTSESAKSAVAYAIVEDAQMGHEQHRISYPAFDERIRGSGTETLFLASVIDQLFTTPTYQGASRGKIVLPTAISPDGKAEIDKWLKANDPFENYYRAVATNNESASDSLKQSDCLSNRAKYIFEGLEQAGLAHCLTPIDRMAITLGLRYAGTVDREWHVYNNDTPVSVRQYEIWRDVWDIIPPEALHEALSIDASSI
ncbi:hypothetical protein A3J15_02870 [Candidatus Roizmanbacteria bacterium RIFCSPLOWO2_02_FULL_38_10]|uniref:Uncharacterized protein n=1 Tax=Candidatus Roizmanbacteria bacterium RIFCSPLOWO2_02_FULL_38_10 TaxID=1802074 RepID=A0A1F7JKN5_9BACT|nr:MAG: hypothetical protein A3J15_02870 [Candidatus Roizmanbacteria bacterium RIFCSPLOWO2_02_FULL_38_10]